MLILLVFLMYVLGAPEQLLRKAIALELLVLFVRFMFIARAVPHLGPMITMLVKVSGLNTSADGCMVACVRPVLHDQNVLATCETVADLECRCHPYSQPPLRRWP